MNAFLDIIGASFLITMLTSLVFQMHFYLYEMSFETNKTYQLQTISETVRELIKSDVKKLGINISENTNILKVAKRNKLKFDYKDSLTDNTTKTFLIKYQKFPNGHDPSINPFDKDLIYRDNGGTTYSYNIVGLTDFNFRYYDIHMNQLTFSELNSQTNRDKVRYIDFKYKLLSSSPIKGDGNINNKKLYPLAVAEEMIFLKTYYE